ncbi:hypothetical protein R50072_31030 [Simiduia litorea]|uniref:ATP-binding protein n=1 Tax=Simiduia litorea TaxID=1435348 RepID=UPI0036F44B7F
MRFDINDTGRGIELSVLDSLFNPVTQTDDAANRLISGTGLGLTLIKRLTEMHKGAVTVGAEYGKGSTFSVWIPSQTS